MTDLYLFWVKHFSVKKKYKKNTVQYNTIITLLKWSTMSQPSWNHEIGEEDKL